MRAQPVAPYGRGAAPTRLEEDVMAATQAGQFDTIVIGGGQAGLAVGYYLKKLGRRFLILDANEQIGGSWRTRTWTSLRLFTPARYNGLPGWPFPAPSWSYPTARETADYLDPSQLRPGDVLLVGAGNSGADIALELSAAHRTFLSGRDKGQVPIRIESRLARFVLPVLWFVASHVLTIKTPLGRKAW